ncbi:hypothetical protein D6825_02730 [Candidatus Woesearchaeota archaeon]|nr:MAG: hypothetical protein D6825_02730 [Candidatus Woesearchaeota archaeon]
MREQTLTDKEKLFELIYQLKILLENQNTVPASIFSNKLSPAEALIKYLKENKGLKNSEIARMLNRDQRGIWSTNKRAQKKMPRAIPEGLEEPRIPLSIFSDRKLSILEHTVTHLRKTHKIADIARILNKDPSTIAAVNHRARRKLE